MQSLKKVCRNRLPRRPSTQILIAALGMSLCRGNLNVLNNIGSFGTENPQMAKQINMILSLSTMLTSWSSGRIVPQLGYSCSAMLSSSVTSCLIGAIMMTTYYTNMPIWIVLILAAMDGMGGSLMSTSVSSLCLLYSSRDNLIYYTSIVNNTFSMWAIALGLLYPAHMFLTEKHYLLTTSVQPIAIIWFLSLFAPLMCSLISTPRALMSVEGVPEDNDHCRTIVDAQKRFGNVASCFHRRLWSVYAFGFAGLVHLPFIYNGINSGRCSFALRGFNTAAFWLGRIPSTFLCSQLLDRPTMSPEKRLRHMWFAMVVITLGSYVLSTLMVHGGIVNDSWPCRIMSIAIFFNFGGLDTAVHSIALYQTKLIFETQHDMVPYVVSYFRTFMSLGSFSAWGISYISGDNEYVTLYSGCAIWVSTFAYTAWAIRRYYADLRIPLKV